MRRNRNRTVCLQKTRRLAGRCRVCITIRRRLRDREEVPQDSDEVIKVETNLTNIFFTAADKNKRFICDLKAEDIRVLEDGQPQEIFTFQQNIDLPLSIAILIDTSISEERTLPDEKAAAQAFLESVMRRTKTKRLLSRLRVTRRWSRVLPAISSGSGERSIVSSLCRLRVISVVGLL